MRSWESSCFAESICAGAEHHPCATSFLRLHWLFFRCNRNVQVCVLIARIVLGFVNPFLENRNAPAVVLLCQRHSLGQQTPIQVIAVGSESFALQEFLQGLLVHILLLSRCS